jgi:catechol 2,3-dioxygenase-like lactoylglutathione lyase family enzyme
VPKKRKHGSAKASSDLEFNHAMVYVRNVALALHFYADLLGFKLIELFQGGHFPSYARLRSPRGHTTLALHKVEPRQVLPETDGVRLYFEVESVERLCKRWRQRGSDSYKGPR